MDPEHDTPEVLSEYVKHHRVSPRGWSFLTGPIEEIKRTVVGGLKAGMGRDGPAPDALFHDSHFVLVDQQMRIRGYYAVEEKGETDRLVRDISVVMAYAARGQ